MVELWFSFGSVVWGMIYVFQLWFSFDAALRVVSCCLVQLWFSFDSDLCGKILAGSELVQLVVDSLLMVQLWFR